MIRAASTITAFTLSLVAVVLLAATWHVAGWFEPQTQHGYPITSYFVGCINLGFVTAYLIASWLLGYRYQREWAVAIGMLAPLPLAAIYEMFQDPTSHNLIPFEIVLFWLPALGMAWGAAKLGARMRGTPTSARPVRDESNAGA